MDQRPFCSTYYFAILIFLNGQLYSTILSSNVTQENVSFKNIVPIYISENITINFGINHSLIIPQDPVQSNKLTQSVYNWPLNMNQKLSVHHEQSLPPNIAVQLAGNLESKLKSIRNTELGIPAIQEIFDAIEFSTIIRNDTETLQQICDKLSTKLERTIDAIDASQIELEKLIKNLTSIDDLFLHSIIHPCPYDAIGTALDQHYDKKQIQIINYLKETGHLSADFNNTNFTVNNQMLSVIKEQYSIYGKRNFKQLYFLSHHDMASDNTNCHQEYSYEKGTINHLKFGRLLTSTIQRKHLLLLIDHGSSLNIEQLELTKVFASNIIHMLNEQDFITIIGISNKANVFLDTITDENYFASNEIDRLPNKMFPATMDNKIKFLQFIENLNKSRDITNHTFGFQVSFDVLKNILTEQVYENDPISLLYISRGLLSPVTEAHNVLEAISNGQRKLRRPIIINTCAIVLDEKRVMYEKQFLRDVAYQNYTKYGISVSDWLLKTMKIQGNIFVVNRRHLNEIAKSCVSIFSNYWFKDPYLERQMIAKLPILDAQANDMIISILKVTNNYNFGVFGTDLYLSDIAEDVIYYNKFKDSYAFIVDDYGFAIMHPSYPRPTVVQQDFYPTDIVYLETIDGFASKVRHRLLSDEMGSITLTMSEGENKKLTYTWRKVIRFYIVCIVTTHNDNVIGKHTGYGSHSISERKDQQYNNYSLNDNIELIYHRIDLITPTNANICRYYKQMATMETGTLFLSASAFKSPFVYRKNNRDANVSVQIHNIKSIMAYVKDTTYLLANPGLLPQIRNDIAASLHVMNFLKKRHLEGNLFKSYVIRRYVATVNGVLQMYPGCVLPSDFDPIRRSWFQKAMESSGNIILTEPYLDAGGAGYIVTIAHTLFEGKSTDLHNANTDVPVAVVAIDVTHGLLYKLLLESSTFCTETQIKCFLMDDKGYLVAHPSILQTSSIPLDDQLSLEHITHKEPYIANDILYHDTLVQKKLCRNWFNRTNQRYYKFNTSSTTVFTNLVPSERTKYQMRLIDGTNVFVAVLNSSCDGGAFCPCSRFDRICLNCNKMEQTNCECPCECEMNGVSIKDADDSINVCPAPHEPVSFKFDSFPYESGDVIIDDLKPCINVNCEQYATQIDCLGIGGCEWCQIDVDGETMFTAPFCTQQTSCFNGILGSNTPYGDGDLGSSIIDLVVPPAYSAVGPVAGAIIALCIVIGFAMYCYRQNVDSGSEQLYIDSVQDHTLGLPLSRLNYDENCPHDDMDFGGNSMNRNLLQPYNGMAEISPYRVNTPAYRRPNGESDHGYSTMTPHEDSEHVCFAMAEPLINRKRSSISDSASIHTSVSSPTNHNHYQGTDDLFDSKVTPHKHHIMPPSDQTILPMSSPHHIQASVIVHHPMEAS